MWITYHGERKSYYRKFFRFPDGQHMKDIDGTSYTYLGILETNKIKEKEMKEKFSQEYLP